MKFRDPIVEEIRAARDAIARECDYDIEKLARTVREHEAKGGRKLVKFPPRRPTAAHKAS
jgi:hypothetical protein